MGGACEAADEEGFHGLLVDVAGVGFFAIGLEEDVGSVGVRGGEGGGGGEEAGGAGEPGRGGIGGVGEDGGAVEHGGDVVGPLIMINATAVNRVIRPIKDIVQIVN